jgi:hypothetical protein
MTLSPPVPRIEKRRFVTIYDPSREMLREPGCQARRAPFYCGYCLKSPTLYIVDGTHDEIIASRFLTFLLELNLIGRLPARGGLHLLKADKAS